MYKSHTKKKELLRLEDNGQKTPIQRTATGAIKVHGHLQLQFYIIKKTDHTGYRACISGRTLPEKDKPSHLWSVFVPLGAPKDYINKQLPENVNLEDYANSKDITRRIRKAGIWLLKENHTCIS